jgi:hypothetical protein
MSYSISWKSGTAVLLALGFTAGAVAPFVTSAPALAQTNFPDVPAGYWAAPFIQELAARGIIVGFAEDGTFRPEDPVTRAQFAAMINKAFNRPAVRPPVDFRDVPPNYWGRSAIEKAYTTGFMAGYPGSLFRPNENIPRAQVLVSLAAGLDYANSRPIDQLLAATFSDAPEIPGYARPGIAAATERRVVVNYPDVRLLNPNRVATRAEVAASIYQALVSLGQVAAIPSPYIVGQVPLAIRIPAGASIPITYGGERILLSKTEPQPIPITFKVAQNVVNAQGQVLIPAGSDVNGQLVVTDGAAQFVANEIVLPDGQRLPVSATSELIRNYAVVRRSPSTGKIIAGTLVGAGAGAGVAAVTGDRKIEAWEVLTGAAAGALAGTLLGGKTVEAIAVDPNTNLLLTLNQDLVLNAGRPAPPPPVEPAPTPAPEAPPSEPAPRPAPAPKKVTPQKY